ncbi:hypothetical protein LEN26_017301 [Aphanomyces euteiches]|nr:hypothetical protein LEN26_017301 [Aphanomyces euteiches]
MKKRRLLALPKSPEPSPGKDANLLHPESPNAQAPSKETDPDVIDLVEETHQNPIQGNLFKLYEKGAGEDWLQLSWMRTREDKNDVFELKMPNVVCKLDDLVQLPVDTPTLDSFESMKPQSTISSENQVSRPISDTKTSRTTVHMLQSWLAGRLPSIPEDVQEFAKQHFMECDWAVILDHCIAKEISEDRLTTLVSQCSCNDLLKQLWLRGPLIARILKPLVHSGDWDVVLCTMLDCEWIQSVSAKDFRQCIRNLNLQSHFGQSDNKDIGAALEMDIIRQFHAKRSLGSR